MARITALTLTLIGRCWLLSSIMRISFLAALSGNSRTPRGTKTATIPVRVRRPSNWQTRRITRKQAQPWLWEVMTHRITREASALRSTRASRWKTSSNFLIRGVSSSLSLWMIWILPTKKTILSTQNCSSLGTSGGNRSSGMVTWTTQRSSVLI